MEKQVKLINRRSYGCDRLFPDCDLSRLISKLTGRSTITDKHLAIIRNAGYAVSITNPQPEE